MFVVSTPSGTLILAGVIWLLTIIVLYWSKPLMGVVNRLAKGQAGTKKALLFVVLPLLSFVFAFSYAAVSQPEPASVGVSVPSTLSSGVPRTAQKHLDHLAIRGLDIVEGVTTADEVFAVLRPSDESGEPRSSDDPLKPGDLLVTHHYEVNGRKFGLEFSRPDPDGPYRVTFIYE